MKSELPGKLVHARRTACIFVKKHQWEKGWLQNIIHSMNVPLLVARIRSWGWKAGLAVLDQGLFSGSNFVLNILLARWLGVSEYGAYSIGFALFLFVTGIHNSLILEPMAVLGPANHANQKSRYLLNQFRLHTMITLLIGLPLAIVGALLSTGSEGSVLIGQAILGMGLFLPTIMLVWLVRRIFYVLQYPLGSLVGSAFYMVFLLGGSFLVRDLFTNPALFWWFGLLGMAGLLSGLIPLIVWRRLFLTNASEIKLTAIEVLSEHWSFGRWVMVATFFNFVATQIQIFAAATILGLDAAGTWRAIQNFILPMMQIITAIVTLNLPSMSSDYGRGELKELNRKGLLITAFLFFLAAIYACTLFVFSSPINNLLYQDKFASNTLLIALISFVPVLAAAESGPSLILRTLQRPVYYLIYTIAMSIAGLIFGPFFVWSFGLLGAGLSQVLVGMTSLGVNFYLYKTWFRVFHLQKDSLSNGLL